MVVLTFNVSLLPTILLLCYASLTIFLILLQTSSWRSIRLQRLYTLNGEFVIPGVLFLVWLKLFLEATSPLPTSKVIDLILSVLGLLLTLKLFMLSVEKVMRER